jgi:hypothetical protein
MKVRTLDERLVLAKEQGIDPYEFHEPIEGVDYELVDTTTLYKVPLKDILSESAQEIYQSLLDRKGEEVPLDEVAKAVAKILQMSFDYDFETARFGNKENKEFKQASYKKMRVKYFPEDTPSLIGLCNHGATLGEIILKSLSKDLEATRVNTEIAPEVHKLPDNNDPLFHALIGIKHNDKYRLLNTVSSDISYNLINNNEQKTKAGIPEDTNYLDICYGDSNDTIVLDPEEIMLDVITEPYGKLNEFKTVILAKPFDGDVRAKSIDFYQDKLDLSKYEKTTVPIDPVDQDYPDLRPGRLGGNTVKIMAQAD